MQANSRPITPPPIMARRGGTSLICSKLVLSTTPSSFRPRIGKEAEVEPVASSICAASIFCSGGTRDLSPCPPETVTVFWSSNVAFPLITSTP